MEIQENNNSREIESLAQRRWRAFRRNRRAWYAFVIFFGVLLVSFAAELIANDKPLIIKYNNEYFFPIFKTYNETVFGGDFPTPADYRDELIRHNIQRNGWMIMPIIPFSFNTIDYDLNAQMPAPPDAVHWLGTDDEGRDILARIIYGLRISIIFAFVLTAVSSLIGVIVGAVQGYFGGKNGYYYSKAAGNMGFSAAVVYFDYCCQCFCADILDFAGDFIVLFLDIADRCGAGRVSAGA